MAKKDSRTALKEFRKAQSAALNTFCRDNNICVRCKNPDKKLKTETLCESCSGYYKMYTQNVRNAAKAVTKKVVKKVTPKKVVKTVKKKGK